MPDKNKKDWDEISTFELIGQQSKINKTLLSHSLKKQEINVSYSIFFNNSFPQHNPIFTEQVLEYDPYCKYCGSNLSEGQSICHVCKNKVD